jgi:hypothetical protein
VAVCNNRNSVNVQRSTTDLPTFQFCSTHFSLDALDD